jgi:hypothetical protein
LFDEACKGAKFIAEAARKPREIKDLPDAPVDAAARITPAR